MKSRIGAKWGYWVILGVGLLLLGWSKAQAQDADPSTALADLKQRLEELERSNQELRNQLQPSSPSSTGQAITLMQKIGDAPAGQENLNEDKVKNIVKDYMKGEDDKKKKADEDKKKADDGFTDIVNNTAMTAKYDNGWILSSANKAFTARVGVEVQLDDVSATAPPNVEFSKGGIGPTTGGINIRRARLDTRGTIFDNFEYMLQWDFGLATAVNNSAGTVNGSVFNTSQPIEIWGMFTELPIIRNIRIGNQKPLWSFENWTSSRFQNFMERSLTWDAFVEDQNNGFIPSIVMLNYLENERMTFQAGIAMNNRSPFFWNKQNGDKMAEGRMTFLPWYEDNGRYLLHLGVGGMYAGTDNGIARFRSRDLLRMTNNQAQNIMTEARMFGDHEARLVPEVVMNLGPFTFQGEYYMAWVDHTRTIANPTQNLGTWFGSGYYAQVMYFITGEYNPYNKQLGRFERPIPHTNFFWHNRDGRSIFGSGAWLTGLRYSWVDLRGLGGVNGAAPNAIGATSSSAGVYDISATLEWIINPNVRILWNGIYEERSTANTPQSNGPLLAAGARLQVDY